MKKFDRDGVYSGSAIVERRRIIIFYTGNVKEEGNYDYHLQVENRM
jgi:beta-fructofuranosidase